MFDSRRLLAYLCFLLPLLTVAQTFSPPINVPVDAETGTKFEDYFFTDIDGDGAEDIVTDAVAVHFYADGEFTFPEWRGPRLRQSRLHEDGQDRSHLLGIRDGANELIGDTLVWYDQRALRDGAPPIPIWSVGEQTDMVFHVADTDDDGNAEVVVVQYPVRDGTDLTTVLLEVNWRENSIDTIAVGTVNVPGESLHSVGFIRDIGATAENIFAHVDSLFYHLRWDAAERNYTAPRPFLHPEDKRYTKDPLVIARENGKFEVYATRTYESKHYLISSGAPNAETGASRSIASHDTSPPVAVDIDGDGDLDVVAGAGAVLEYVDQDHIYTRFVPLSSKFRMRPATLSGRLYLAVWPNHQLTLKPVGELNPGGEESKYFKKMRNRSLENVTIGDIDGKEGDEIVINYRSEVRIVRRGEFPGSYLSEKVDIELPEGRDKNVDFIDLRDTDGDGDKDLIICLTESKSESEFTEFSTLRNDGGRFRSIPEPFDTLPLTVYGVQQIIDIHNDGRFDYQFGGGYSMEKVYVQRPDTAYLIDLKDTYTDGGRHRFRDYDGDGWVDLFVEKFSGTSPYLDIYLNDGGTFAEQAIRFAGVTSYYAADLDSNGTLEVIHKPQSSPVTFIAFYDPATGKVTNDDRLGLGAPSIQESGDYDGDGKFDLLRVRKSNYSDPVVEIRYGRDERWQPIFKDDRATYLGNPTYNVRTVDFDRDGQRELFIRSAVAGSYSAAIFEADGPDAAYEQKIRLSTPLGIIADWVDVNGDGLDDLLYHDENGTAVQPTESPYSTVAPSYNLRQRARYKNPRPWAAQVADINGNAFSDLVIQYENEILEITEFTPEGFRTLQEFENIPVNEVLLSDIDRDGLVDIGIYGTTHVRFHRNRGEVEDRFRLFPISSEVIVRLADSLDRIDEVIRVADTEAGDRRYLVYGSGKLFALEINPRFEVVVRRLLSDVELSGTVHYQDISPGGNKEVIVSVEAGSVFWTYALTEAYPLSLDRGRLLCHFIVDRRALFDDFDQDGDTDIIGHNYLLTQVGPDTTLRLSSLPKVMPNSLMNLDGQAPLDWESTKYIKINNAETQVNPAMNLTFQPSRATSQYKRSGSLHVGDVDSDGVTDLVLSDRDHYGINWMPGRYAGSNGVEYDFPRPVSGLYSFPNLLHVADFDGDGYSDFLYCIDDNDGSADGLDFEGTHCYVGLKGRTDSVERHVPVDVPLGKEPSFVDYDRDGDVDIGWTTAYLQNRLNEGGGFSLSVPDGLSHPANYSSGQLADLDGDGDLDWVNAGISYTNCEVVVVVGWRIDEVTFSPLESLHRQPVDWCRAASLAQVYDYDRDGDMDVLIDYLSKSWKNELLLYELEDNAVQRVETVIEVNELRFANIDDNGVPDLIFDPAEEGDWDEPHQVAVHMNFQEGSTNRKPWTMNNYPFFPYDEVILADLNGDGARDLLAPGGNQVGGHPYYSLNEGTGPELTARILLDKDGDGRGEDDQPLADLPLILTSTGEMRFSGPAGQVFFPVREGVYELGWVEHPLWELTPATSPRQMASTEQSAEEAPVFSVRPRTDTVLFEQSIITDPTRCGFTVRARYSFANAGTRDLDSAVYYVVIPPQVKDVSNILPEPVRRGGDTLYFRAPYWRVTENMYAAMDIRMPGVEAIGRSIRFASGVVIPSGAEFTHELKSVVTCAYDPNDKAANPDRGGDEAYLLFDEWIYYTIRFQNTGNDTAFTVRLEDQLDASLLDIGTFKVLQTTHRCTTDLTEGGRVTFTFDNIMLPDSNRNEPDSHGAVQFKIRPRDGLPDYTKLENEAAIYFDFNPPIITNTVTNTLVETLPTTAVRPSGKGDFLPKIFPNPVSRQLHVELPRGSGKAALKIYNATGSQVRAVDLTRENTELDVADLPSGPYLVQIINPHAATHTEWVIVQRR